MASPDGPPRVLLIAALMLAVATIGAVLAIAVTQRRTLHPLAIPTIPAPHAQDPACRALLAALPQQLGDYDRVDTSPTPTGTVVWQHDGAAVVVQCGLNRPTDFVVGSPIQVVDQVQWFATQSTWCTVDRPVYVALTLPPGSGPTPIQQMSEVIDRTIAAVPIDPA